MRTMPPPVTMRKMPSSNMIINHIPSDEIATKLLSKFILISLFPDIPSYIAYSLYIYLVHSVTDTVLQFVSVSFHHNMALVE